MQAFGMHADENRIWLASRQPIQGTTILLCIEICMCGNVPGRYKIGVRQNTKNRGISIKRRKCTCVRDNQAVTSVAMHTSIQWFGLWGVYGQFFRRSQLQ